ncbi:hypothetical protein, partial [Vibrio splendidus]|uniref:hypothetical protein n=1 Tax=Vibrio splendidus TaxID=29497 RepID=UPI003D09AC9B
KTEFTLKNILKFISKPSSIIQILLMEFSIMNKTTDFDVYCISDFGKCSLKENNQGYVINTGNFSNIVTNNYKTFLHYINSKQHVQCLDHQPDTPLLDNLESALHMCGTVGYNVDFKFDHESRIYEIFEDIIVNDNSIIIDKGIANPSIQLF